MRQLADFPSLIFRSSFGEPSVGRVRQVGQVRWGDIIGKLLIAPGVGAFAPFFEGVEFVFANIAYF